MGSIRCGKCGAELSAKRSAFISVFVQGDEETRSWYLCEKCRVWMIEFYYDHFMGDDDIRVSGPFPEEQWKADVALAKTCPDPGSKWCDCPAHKKLSPG